MTATRSPRPGGPCRPRRDPLALLEEIDRHRNLPTALAIGTFVVSAALGVAAFFLLTELVLRTGVTAKEALLFVSIAWVLIFPLWALAYLVALTLFGALGIKDLRAMLRRGLATRSLSPDQRRDLHRALAARTWRHPALLRRALADLPGDTLGGARPSR